MKTKESLDALNLNLQSLIYEKSHFLKEINICKDFTCAHLLSTRAPNFACLCSSAEKEIALIPEAEFQKTDDFRKFSACCLLMPLLSTCS